MTLHKHVGIVVLVFLFNLWIYLLHKKVSSIQTLVRYVLYTRFLQLTHVPFGMMRTAQGQGVMSRNPDRFQR